MTRTLLILVNEESYRNPFIEATIKYIKGATVNVVDTIVLSDDPVTTQIKLPYVDGYLETWIYGVYQVDLGDTVVLNLSTNILTSSILEIKSSMYVLLNAESIQLLTIPRDTEVRKCDSIVEILELLSNVCEVFKYSKVIKDTRITTNTMAVMSDNLISNIIAELYNYESKKENPNELKLRVLKPAIDCDVFNLSSKYFNRLLNDRAGVILTLMNNVGFENTRQFISFLQHYVYSYYLSDFKAKKINVPSESKQINDLKLTVKKYKELQNYKIRNLLISIWRTY